MTLGNNKFPFFINNDYKMETVENIMLLHTMKYIYKYKYNEIKLNIQHYRAGLEHINSVCYSMSTQKPFLKKIKSD